MLLLSGGGQPGRKVNDGSHGYRYGMEKARLVRLFRLGRGKSGRFFSFGDAVSCILGTVLVTLWRDNGREVGGGLASDDMKTGFSATQNSFHDEGGSYEHGLR